jgi:hypothetical protein
MTSFRGAPITMLDVVLSAILGAYRAAIAAMTGIVAGDAYNSNAKGVPVARKCPTLMHSVRPIMTRLTIGWCT